MYIFQTTISLLLMIAGLIYFIIKNKQKYWTHYNVPNEPKSIFFFARHQHVGEYFTKVYNRFRNCKSPFVGCFSIFTPAALILDLELIKRILITDFYYFPGRGFYHNVQDDPLSSNLLRLDGEKWRRLRSKLTPSFSSGKLKFMFPTKIAVGHRLVATIQNLLRNGKNELDMRDLCARFTTDIIGSVAFGIECNSLDNPNTKFRILGDKAFASFRPVFEKLATTYPKLFQSLHMTVFSQELIMFYTKIVKETFALREEKNIKRNDFFDILRELRNTQTEDGEPMLTLDEMIGQCFMFLIAGYETSSSTLTFCLYELSKNQEIQQKARADIVQTIQRLNGQLTYDSLKDMRYLQQVIDETFRMHPISPVIRRTVSKRYLVPGTSIYLERGVHALIPVYAIHHDPLYYAEPEKFIPERFTADEIKNRHSMCHLPFGAGPRICIAERFGRIEVLLGLALLLKHFRFSPSEKTPKKLEYNISEKRIFKVDNLFLHVENL